MRDYLELLLLSQIVVFSVERKGKKALARTRIFIFHGPCIGQLMWDLTGSHDLPGQGKDRATEVGNRLIKLLLHNDGCSRKYKLFMEYFLGQSFIFLLKPINFSKELCVARQ